MPRGIPKTWAERMKDSKAHDRRVQKRLKEKPPKSPCLPGRVYHPFRHPRTMGSLNVKYHGDMECWWCKKTYRQVVEERKAANKVSQSTNKDAT